MVKKSLNLVNVVCERPLNIKYEKNSLLELAFHVSVRFLICLNIRIILGLESCLLLKLINIVPSFPTRPGLTRPPYEFIHKFYILIPKKLHLKAESLGF